VHFAEYEVNESRTLTLYVRNVSSLTRQVRIVPPTTAAFSLAAVKFPSADSRVAAGMHVDVQVRLQADHLGEFHDAIEVQPEGSPVFFVPLLAKRSPPHLDLAPEINLGAFLVNTDMSVVSWL
jgi:hypothetical protein